MSVNTAHANNGVLIHSGEYILLHSDCVVMEFSGQDNPLFKGPKHGRIYLTSHRIIYNTKKSDMLMSFSAPFVALSDVELEQPVFGANYIRGKVRAQPNGNFVGEVKFKLYFKAGGAIEYGQALLRAAKTAQSNDQNGQFGDDPPPYTPSGSWHEAPPPAYQPPPGYYGWLPTHDAFRGPAPNSVYVSDNPPPYPGIAPLPNDAGGQQAMIGHDQPNRNGFSAPPSDQEQLQMQMWGGGRGGYQPQQPQHPQQGWGGYQPPPFAAPGYAPPGYVVPYGGGGVPQAVGFAMVPGGPAPPGYMGGFQGYPGNYLPPQGGYGGPTGGGGGGAMGFSAPPANPKEAEALASAFHAQFQQRGNGNPGANDMLPPYYNDGHDGPPHFHGLNGRRHQ